MCSVVTLSNEDNVKLSKDLFTGIGSRQKWNQETLIISNLQEFCLMLLLKEVKNCLFLLSIILIMVPRKLKQTATKHIFVQN